MTAALMCDQCGALITERGTEGEDTTVRWLRLEQDPSISAPGLSLSLELNAEEDPDTEYVDVPPAWHFCSIECLRIWAGVQVESATKEQ